MPAKLPVSGVRSNLLQSSDVDNLVASLRRLLAEKHALKERVNQLSEENHQLREELVELGFFLHLRERDQ